MALPRAIALGTFTANRANTRKLLAPGNKFMKKLSLQAIRKMPTLKACHYDDLKMETPVIRVYLSRMTIQDGQPYNNMVTVEQLVYPATNRARWETTEQYEAK